MSSSCNCDCNENCNCEKSDYSVFCNSQIYGKDDKPDIKFFYKDGTEIRVSEIIMSTSGTVVSVIDESGKEIFKDHFDICSNFLEVPGIGFLRPGSIVRIKENEYQLNFGEHANISNQRLISWYLRPMSMSTNPDPLGRVTSESITLTCSHINEIDLVTI